jgi:hypothetical protein
MIKITIKKSSGNKSKQFTNANQAQEWLKRQIEYCREMNQKILKYVWEK